MENTNPKKRYGSAKPSTWDIPPVAIFKLGQAMAEGAAKYGRFNWRDNKVDSSTYYNAMMRHLLLWGSGEDYDPLTGVSHLAYIMANCCVLIDAEAHLMLHDDRRDDGGAKVLATVMKELTKELPIE